MTVTPIAELEPCPFCGESNSIVCETAYGDGQAYAVSCRSRGCHGAIFALGFGLFETPAKAIAAWNTRAESSTLSTLSARVESLEAALRPFAEPHFMGDNYVSFAPRLIVHARSLLSEHLS